ncbi:unnamed protein product [Arctogadus glacialis]
MDFSRKSKNRILRSEAIQKKNYGKWTGKAFKNYRFLYCPPQKVINTTPKKILGKESPVASPVLILAQGTHTRACAHTHTHTNTRTHTHAHTDERGWWGAESTK